MGSKGIGLIWKHKRDSIAEEISRERERESFISRVLTGNKPSEDHDSNFQEQSKHHHSNDSIGSSVVVTHWLLSLKLLILSRTLFREEMRVKSSRSTAVHYLKSSVIIIIIMCLSLFVFTSEALLSWWSWSESLVSLHQLSWWGFYKKYTPEVLWALCFGSFPKTQSESERKWSNFASKLKLHVLCLLHDSNLNAFRETGDVERMQITFFHFLMTRCH